MQDICCADVPKCRDIVNEVIESKEVLKVAGERLISISQDERERAIFRSRRIYQSDLESNLATAEERGIKRVAQRMLMEGEPVSRIAHFTGLSESDITALKGQLLN